MKRLWHIRVWRQSAVDVYVLADEEDAAREDAEALVENYDWDTEDTDYVATEVTDAARAKLSRHEIVWTGGPDGEDITVGQVDKYLEQHRATLPPPEIPGQMRIDGSVVGEEET